ncbi:MAG: HEAT repeat domain-containing protein [Bryobacteraceae bacterium]|nr:HEAT repeat domain-containing protein [Bryobacteraceae bacterium]
MKTALVLVLSGCAAWAQPQLQNARVETAASAGSFRATYEATVAAQRDPAWLGFAVEARPQQGTVCCWTNQCMGCGLEGRADFRQVAPPPAGPVRLEGSRRRFVLIRALEGRVDKVRVFGEECPLDAGGLRFVWLGEAKPLEVLPLLETYIREGREEGLHVLSQLADPAATELLIQTARNDARGNLRSKALFWLAQQAAQKAAGVIQSAVENDPDTQVRRQAVFALSQLPREQAVPMLIDVAKTSSHREARRQAVFWLGQSKDARALNFIESLLRP